MDHAHSVARRVGMQIIQEKKAEIMKAATDEKGAADALASRDLLTLLLKANMSTDIPESQRMSDEDVLARESALSNYPRRALTYEQRSRRTSCCAPVSIAVADCAKFLDCGTRDHELRHSVDAFRSRTGPAGPAEAPRRTP